LIGRPVHAAEWSAKNSRRSLPARAATDFAPTTDASGLPAVLLPLASSAPMQLRRVRWAITFTALRIHARAPRVYLTQLPPGAGGVPFPWLHSCTPQNQDDERPAAY